MQIQEMWVWYFFNRFVVNKNMNFLFYYYVLLLLELPQLAEKEGHLSPVTAAHSECQKNPLVPNLRIAVDKTLPHKMDIFI